jgi:hypothetical protein
MFPYLSDKYFPQFFKRDTKLAALTDLIDRYLGYWRDDLLGYETLIDPVRCPANLLNELGYFLNAGIFPQDDENQRRTKIAHAVSGHKRRGSFVYDAKPKIDAIAGGNSSIIHTSGLDDFILVGDGTEPTAFYWAALGCDGLDDGLGISLVGAGTEMEVAGNVYIDVDNPTLTATEIQQLVDELEFDIAPVYYYVHLGYIAAGIFVEYTRIG